LIQKGGILYLNEKRNIVIRGAREHNLKSINLDLPRNKLIVVTGLSGSGKSSLAFDTIYAEGQRQVCGEPLQLRPAVSGAVAETGCGFYLRFVTGDCMNSALPEAIPVPLSLRKQRFTTI